MAERVGDLFELWGLDRDEVEIRISRRMTRSIGNARIDENRITLAVWLFDQPDELVDEVLCHEAAHLAIRRLHGPGARPHGVEWRDLMRRAGHAARTRIEVPFPPPVRPRRHRRPALGRLSRLLRGLTRR